MNSYNRTISQITITITLDHGARDDNIVSSSNISQPLSLSVDAPAHEALDAPLDSDLGHGQAAALRPLVLLVEGLGQRVTGGRGGGGVVSGIHPPCDVYGLRGVRRGPGASGGHGARGQP